MRGILCSGGERDELKISKSKLKVEVQGSRFKVRGSTDGLRLRPVTSGKRVRDKTLPIPEAAVLFPLRLLLFKLFGFLVCSGQDLLHQGNKDNEEFRRPPPAKKCRQNHLLFPQNRPILALQPES
jgi:hypothetical protein